MFIIQHLLNYLSMTTGFTNLVTFVSAFQWHYLNMYINLYLPPVPFPLLIISSIAVISGLAGIFRKSGKPIWIAFVPFYNVYTLADIAGVKRGILYTVTALYIIGATGHYVRLDLTVIVLSLLLTFVGWIFICVGLKNRFSLSVPLTIALVVAPFIMLPVLGFSSKEYDQGQNSIISDDGMIRLSGLSLKRFEKFRTALQQELLFTKIIGGRAGVRIRYITIVNIPVWFQFDETFFFISENGAMMIKHSIWKGIKESYSFKNETIAGITLQKNKLSRKLLLTLRDTSAVEVDANSGSFLTYLGNNLNSVVQTNPSISINGDYIPEEHAHQMSPNNFEPLQPQNACSVEL